MMLVVLIVLFAVVVSLWFAICVVCWFSLVLYVCCVSFCYMFDQLVGMFAFVVVMFVGVILRVVDLCCFLFVFDV